MGGILLSLHFVFSLLVLVNFSVHLLKVGGNCGLLIVGCISTKAVCAAAAAAAAAQGVPVPG
jgi:hypothetical protein